MLVVETGLALIAIFLAIIWPTLGASSLDRVESLVGKVARNRKSAVLAIALATMLMRIAVLPVEPVPHPSVHDEFSYLLQADTFLHGRVANPTPPMWQHLETFHEIFQPTYCSKFFPGQGLFLSLGQLCFGHPYWGVWLTSGLMCAAITWMLQGWFSPQWAFLGGALALLRFGVFGYWANSYWGGNIAAIAGGLVVGALPRMKPTVRWQYATVMGVGLGLLAISRPWEGLVLSIPVVVMVLWDLFVRSGRPPVRVSLRRVALPLFIVLAITGGWLAYYCWRTTGNALTSPYQVYEQTYGAVPYMVWQHLRPEPIYRDPVLRTLDIDQELVSYRIYHELVGHLSRVFAFTGFFLGPLLLVPFGALPFALPYGFALRNLSHNTRRLLAVLIVFACGTEMVIFYNPHYSSPATCLVIAFILLAMKYVREWNRSGLFLSRSVFLACVLAFAARIVAVPLHIPYHRFSTYGWYDFFAQYGNDWFPRASIESRLKGIVGDHLVIVRYGARHEPFPEWVYNDADVENSRIVWARDMGSKNRELLNHFRARMVWLLEADKKPARLSAYKWQSIHETKH
jgi:hypothetical protein